MSRVLASLDVLRATDAVVAATVVRRAARDLGISRDCSARLATCSAELASNAVVHGGGGHLELTVEDDGALVVSVVDRGPGRAADVRPFACGDRTASPEDARVYAGIGTGLSSVTRLIAAPVIRDRDGGGLRVTVRVPCSISTTR